MAQPFFALRRSLLPTLTIFGALALGTGTAGCGDVSDVESDDSALAVDTATAAADGSGRVSVKAGALTLTFNEGRLTKRGKDRVLIIPGNANRDIEDIHSSVPDDMFGQIEMRGPRSFDLVLTGDHEINTVLSGLQLLLQITTKTGTPVGYQARVTIGARAEDVTGAAGLRPLETIRPVSAGTTADALRYRIRLETTKTPSRIEVQGELLKRSARRFDVDYTYGAFAGQADKDKTSFAAVYGVSTEITWTGFSFVAAKVGLTTKVADDVWPLTCAATVSKCIAKVQAASSIDFGDCGDYRDVRRCLDADPPPPPSFTAAEKRINAEIAKETGVKVSVTVGDIHQEGARSIALALIGRGGTLNFALDKNATPFLGFASRPSFLDGFQVNRFQTQLPALGYKTAKIVSMGTIPGGAPQWQFALSDNGKLTAIALEATSATEFRVIPFVYDESTFRQVAGPLAVAEGIELAKNIGPYGELEVYLKALNKFSNDKGFELVSVADSPVGFDATKEVQLVTYSFLGDNAVYVTLDKKSGALRVATFN